MIYTFISDGRLFIRYPDGKIKEIESHFVREKMEFAENYKSHRGWQKNASSDNPYYNSGTIWGGQASATPSATFRFKNVVKADENTIYYILTNNMVTGLFEYDITNDEEARLFHKNDIVELGLDYSTKRNEFAIALLLEDGQVNIELLDNRGSYKQDLTGGDSRDTNPSFSKTNPDQILFQSSGIARDEEGFPMAHGPECIHRIDLETGDITGIIASDQYDYMLPKEDQLGNIYCIQRPYKQFGHVSPFRYILSIILFPINFLIAIVNFLNAFTQLFNKNTLTPGGPNVQTPKKQKYVNVLGQTINLAKVKKFSSDEYSLVPGSWKLIKITPDKNTHTIANKVSSYDIDNDGNIHYTNGYKVHTVSENTQTNLQFKHPIIENITTK